MNRDVGITLLETRDTAISRGQDVYDMMGGKMQKPPEIVLFLDIDGVIMTTRSMTACPDEHVHLTDLSPNRIHQFDTTAIGIIRHLCESTGAQIILSSSWRYSSDFNELAEFLGLPIVGRTTILSYEDMSRGSEIQEWLEINGRPEKWAAVDDLPASTFPLSIQSRLVTTTFNNGLQWEHYSALHKLLS